jgi:hypothetical protein
MGLDAIACQAIIVLGIKNFGEGSGETSGEVEIPVAT